MPDFVIKQGDLLPILNVEFSDSLGVLNLSGCSVNFNFQKRGESTITTGVCSLIAPESGLAKYEWQAGDTDNVGRFQSEFVITFPDSKELTFPASRYVTFEVIREV